jgi:signal transduction histidine kinase
MATAWLDPARTGEGPSVEAGAARATGTARTRALVWLTLAFWLSSFVLMNLGSALSGNPHLAGLMGMRALALLYGLLLCYLIHRVLNRPGMASLRRRIVALALMAPVAAETYAWVNFFAEMAVDPSVGFGNVTWPNTVRAISFWTWFFLAWAGLYLALLYSFDIREERRHVAELQAQAHAAQLRALHSQINPHFLFNSLNSVSALILDGKSSEAEAMISKLSQFLRMGLAVDPGEKIPLAREIALQRAYLDIERQRYPDLDVSIAVPRTVEDLAVPSLILQPIVENAVKYGVASSPPPARIAIAAQRDGESLRIEVTDDGAGPGAAAKGAGIGLRHVAGRLRLLYGEHAALSHGPRPAGGYRAALVIPAEPS